MGERQMTPARHFSCLLLGVLFIPFVTVGKEERLSELLYFKVLDDVLSFIAAEPADKFCCIGIVDRGEFLGADFDGGDEVEHRFVSLNQRYYLDVLLLLEICGSVHERVSSAFVGEDGCRAVAEFSQ